MVDRDENAVRASVNAQRVVSLSAILWFTVVVLTVIIMFTSNARAAATATEDPKLEQRVHALASELRCMVCQNQSLADSHAGLAVDLKNQIREKMRQGENEAQITSYMVERYGDFVLYRPPLKATTVVLWAGPFLLMIAGIVLLMLRLRRRRSEQAVPLSTEEHARAAALLAERDGEPR